MYQNNPPEELSEFFEWLRIHTEEAWAKLPEPTIQDFERSGVGGDTWRPGTHWLPGLTNSEIEAVERRWNLRFPADYRLFLRMLHAPNRPLFRASFQGRTLVESSTPSFFNWLTDLEAIQSALDWPLEGLVFDFTHNNLWFDDWGSRPADEKEVERKIGSLIAAAPKLVPIFGHRYIVEADTAWGYVVLSIWQSDIIVYEQDLRRYLLQELRELFGLPTFDFDQINSHMNELMGFLDESKDLTELLANLPPLSNISPQVFQASLKIPFWGQFLE